MPSLGIFPQPDESLPGILVRLAARTGIPGAHRLAAMTTLRQPGSAVAMHDLGKLAAFGGFEPADLERAAYRPVARFAHHRFLSGEVHREFIDLARRRWCPICLADSAHHRKAWDFGLLTACPTHALRLADRCPRCRRPVDWRHPSILHCRCGASLSATEVFQVAETERLAAARLLELLGSEQAGKVPARLASLGGSDTIWMAMGLGMLVTGWRRDRRVETLIAAGPDRVQQVMAAGLAVVDDWPIPLHRYLGELAAAADGRPGRFGARKTLGAFYDWLTIMEREDVRRVLLEAAAGFVDADAVLGCRVHRSKLLAGVSTGQPSGMTLSEVGAALGMRGAKLAKLGRLGLVPVGEGGGQGLPMIFDRQAVEAFAGIVAGSVGLAETASLLGISKARVRRLAEAGLLKPLHRADQDGLAAWSFGRAEIEGFLPDLQESTLPVADEDLVGFEFAIEALRIRGRPFVEAVRMMRGGVLPAVAVNDDATGLKRLRFRRVEVRRICDEVDGRMRVTVAEAAKRLGIKWEMAAHLVRKGLLHGGAEGLDVAGIDRFAREYVTGSQLARDRKTSPRALAAKLARRGILPVAGTAVDGARQNIYRRMDLSGWD